MLCCLPRRTTHTHTLAAHSLLDTARIMAGSELLFQLCHFFVPRFCESAWPQVPNTHWSLVCIVQSPQSCNGQLRAHTHTHSHNVFFYSPILHVTWTSVSVRFTCPFVAHFVVFLLCFLFCLFIVDSTELRAGRGHIHTHTHTHLGTILFV